MKVALFLHAYQPPIQYPEVTKKVTDQSYVPIINLLTKYPQSRITMNVSASLTEQLVTLHEDDLIGRIAYLSSQRQLELVSTAAYHPLLAKLPEDEIVRQRNINDQINQNTFGIDSYQPGGFFLPEMIYERRVGETLSNAGVQWVILDESAYPLAKGNEEWGTSNHYDMKISKYIHKLVGLPTYVFFRDRPLSLLVAFNGNLSIDNVIENLKRHYIEGQEGYVVLAMDAETFGHHHHENLHLLESMMSNPFIELVSISELFNLGLPINEIEPVRSTWGVTIETDDQQRTFPRWDNPNNPVHKLQWQLFDLALAVREHNNDHADLLDKGINSDQFWWASANPCWHPPMIERGAQFLKSSIINSSKADNKQKNLAHEIFDKIVEVSKLTYGTKIQNC